MINILMPMAGGNRHFPESDFPFPKPLIEIGQFTVIEHVVKNLNTINENIHFVFVVSEEDCRRFNFDSTLSIITDFRCSIVRIKNETKGATCSALMAISIINNNIPLIIANADQVFADPLPSIVNLLKRFDAGVVTFESVHPRWSYVRVDEQGFVQEAVEKHPISRNAIAGLYYFSRGEDFVQAAMRSIQKGIHTNGIYYIAPILNELILQGRKIRAAKIEIDRYHTLYTPQKLKEYERSEFLYKILKFFGEENLGVKI